MSNQTEKRITALYCRLSQEDEKKGDSDSIVNQKEMLQRYAKQNGFTNTQVFVDDGYSGVSFNRPGFQSLLELMENGKVETLITKDLSRLGRNYLEVGQYTEIMFPRWNVRYIAVNDNYDSLYTEGNELAPFKNLFNEWYARDTSKKIRAVLKAKAERGERIGTSIPYGYKRDPEHKGRLLVNEETAPIVRRIFELCAQGMGPKNIGNVLRDEKIFKPTFYRYQSDGYYGTITDTDVPYGWSSQTISKILGNEIYLGHTINCKTRVVSFKDKRTVEVPKNEQYRFENTHEAIIDQETWDAVQKVRQGKRRRNSMGEIDKYSGLLYCADCGSKLYFVRGKSITPDAYNFICSRYRKHVGEQLCSAHRIREMALDEIVLEEIRCITYYARTKTKEFVQVINNKSSSENKRELTAKTIELSRKENRNDDLNALFKRLYEDNVLGKVTNEQFRMLSEGYNAEQKEIAEQIPVLQKQIEELKAATVNIEKFIAIANKYTDLQELTAEVLRTFVAKIVIHERTTKWAKTSEQQIDIYFRYIGYLEETNTKQAV
ncbi:MAG: recombinase family protein [Clostridia bacterium]|nr:recombinase family protein [Clostridia bacterium]